MYVIDREVVDFAVSVVVSIITFILGRKTKKVK